MTDPEHLMLVVRAVKVGVVTAAGAVGAMIADIVAQVALPEGWGDTASTVGIVGLMAILLGRYTFRQLEGYRSDLTYARERNDMLQAKIDKLQADLTELGRAKAAEERKVREGEEAYHRLAMIAIKSGIDPTLIPPSPAEAS